jgi:hypothetical protein
VQDRTCDRRGVLRQSGLRRPIVRQGGGLRALEGDRAGDCSTEVRGPARWVPRCNSNHTRLGGDRGTTNRGDAGSNSTGVAIAPTRSRPGVPGQPRGASRPSEGCLGSVARGLARQREGPTPGAGSARAASALALRPRLPRSAGIAAEPGERSPAGAEALGVTLRGTPVEPALQRFRYSAHRSRACRGRLRSGRRDHGACTVRSPTPAGPGARGQLRRGTASAAHRTRVQQGQLNQRTTRRPRSGRLGPYSLDPSKS